MDYGFSRKAVDALDDGTYIIFYFRGYKPEHAMLEIYGPPNQRNKPERPTPPSGLSLPETPVYPNKGK
jgi:hypothetical protein